MSQSSNLLMWGSSSSAVPSSKVFAGLKNEFTISKKKRRPAGTPDPHAEVVSLSPETLMGTDYYVCEICKQGFQREQNLQMHRRRHNVPWKLLKRDVPDTRKRVYVCPEPTCLHHQPCHALGDLVGIKKHFRRKHSNRKQWVCEKCSKGYAVQSDYKAHLKTCGTRGHFCDCGRVFSRVETFIEHQDKCKEAPKPAYLLKTSISPDLAINTNIRTAPPTNSELVLPNCGCGFQFSSSSSFNHNKLPWSMPLNPIASTSMGLSVHSFWETEHATKLKLSLGSASHIEKDESNGCRAHSLERINGVDEEPLAAAQRLKEEAHEQLQMAMEETALAEEKRRQANWQIELAKLELTNARKIREQAMVELNKAHVLKERATKQINPTMQQITCNACRRQYYQSITKEAGCGQQSPAVSCMSWVGHYRM